jgi:hypothetical protein
MDNKFDSFISEMIGMGRTSMRSEKLRNIRQDLMQSSSNIESLAYHYQTVVEDESKAESLRSAAAKIDEARKILFDLQD